jgi:hypothetical protein
MKYRVMAILFCEDMALRSFVSSRATISPTMDTINRNVSLERRKLSRHSWSDNVSAISNQWLLHTSVQNHLSIAGIVRNKTSRVMKYRHLHFLAPLINFHSRAWDDFRPSCSAFRTFTFFFLESITKSTYFLQSRCWNLKIFYFLFFRKYNKINLFLAIAMLKS